MLIVNPLYDNAFKYLMENNRLAKKVLSVILDVEIEELTIGQQETIILSETHRLNLFRLDFKATIVKPDGTKYTVLIELQKSKVPTDIRRFRNYLGANYISDEILKKDDEKPSTDQACEPAAEYKTIFPIITIYILGYELDDLPYLAVTVNRDVTDSVTQKPIRSKCFFIEHLTHQSHILQVKRLPEKRRTRLEKFLTLFNQAWVSDKKFILDLQEIPEEFADIAEHLSKPVLDKKFRTQLEGEQEIEDILDVHAKKFLKKIEAAEKEKDEALAEKEKERAEKILAQKRETEALNREREALNKIRSMVLKLHAKGFDIQNIADTTELSIDEVTRILEE